MLCSRAEAFLSDVSGSEYVREPSGPPNALSNGQVIADDRRVSMEGMSGDRHG
jgi:hypothetical protein